MQHGRYVTVADENEAPAIPESGARGVPSADSAPSLTTLMDNLNGMVYRCRNDRDWSMLFVSEGCRSLTGYAPSDLLDKGTVRFANIIHPEDRRTLWHTVQDALADRRAFRLEYRIIDSSGDERWVRENGCGVFDRAGRVEALEGFVSDITEEKQAEKEIRLLGEAFKSIGEAVTVTDLDNTILFANEGFLATYGYSRDEIEGMRVDRLRVEGECSENLEAMVHQTLRGGWKGEVVNQRKNGTRFPAFLSTSVVRDDNGKPVALIGVIKDLTEERKLQSQLHQAQRMEAVGRLAGGVAHDFNNLLTVINGYSEVLLDGMEETDPSWKSITQIARAGERAGSLTQQLLAFSRKQVIQPRLLSLNKQIAETEKMLRRLIGEDIRLKTSLESDLGFIQADPSQIDQILLNLAVNSRDAMPQGGELVIESQNFEIDETYRAVHPQAIVGQYVMIAVTDTGSGMDAATKERIFEPFFSTKKRGEGTGLGLATVYGIVKQNKGYIWVYSELGKGTSFKIYFPRIDSESPRLSAPESPVAAIGGSETILLVEDETWVRDLTARVLEASGYRVLKARSGSEAIDVAKAQKAELRLLLTDVVLPGRSGRELAQELQAIKPEIEVIYMSGYTDETIERHGLLGNEVAFVQKPYSNKKLLRLVRGVLDDGTPAETRPRARGPEGTETNRLAAIASA